jgi:hypothetical protein
VLQPGGTPVAAPTLTPRATPSTSGVDLRISGVSRVVGAFQPFSIVGRSGLASVRQSYNVTYRISYTNAGDTAATGVTLSASIPSAALLLGPEAVWSGSGGTFSGALGTVPARSSGSVQILLRSAQLDPGDSFPASFSIGSAGARDLAADDNAYTDLFVIADDATGAAATPTPLGQVIGPSATPTATSTPSAIEVVLAPGLPSVLSTDSGLVVLVPPGAVESTMYLLYEPQPTPTPTPGASNARPSGSTRAASRVVQAFRLSLRTTSSMRTRTIVPGGTFRQPVVVSLQYDDAMLGGASPAGLVLARQAADGRLVSLTTAVDTSARIASATIDAPGSYVLLLNDVPFRVFLPMQVRAGTAP